MPCVACFETSPLLSDTTVIGDLSAEIFVDSSPISAGLELTDCDLMCVLLDVDEQGRAWNLYSPGQFLLRASYRNRSTSREPLVPGQITKLVFFGAVTANTFLRGHRIRVLLCSSWFPTYARNLQNGKSEHESADATPARISIHHGSKYPSQITLPVLR